MTALDDLLDILDLDQVAPDSFEGRSPVPDAVRIFGGQVAAQAAVATSRTVADGRRLVSMQCTFLRMGSPRLPLRFDVTRLADGRGFSYRQVAARQGERLLFTATTTFQVPADGPDHAVRTHPQSPDDIPAWDPAFPALMTDAFELRRSFDDTAGAGRGLTLAVRTAGPLPDDPHLHAALAVYVSDLFILDASLAPHQPEPVPLRGPYLVASIDHAIHLHRPVRLDDWVVNRFESPTASAGLSGLRCAIRTADGDLAASVLQVGLLQTDPSYPYPD